MPFNSILTAPQITQIRKPSQAFEHYVLVTPIDIVWQAQVSETLTDTLYGQIGWVTTLQGAWANVVEGQVILITTSDTDFSNPILRQRARLVPDANYVYVGKAGTNIDTTMYITVFDDFDIVFRAPRIEGEEQFIDWGLDFQELPPLIAGLQSAYVDFSRANPVAFEFSPTAVATASGAAIATWAWDIGDGSYTGGTSSSDQNIECTFPGESVNEHRWVHLTVTDDNGVASLFHFQVFTVDKTSSSVVLLDSGQLAITASIEDGYNTSITGWNGVGLSAILDQTRVVIAGIDTFDIEGTPDDTPINTNILMVGRLRNEVSTTEADEQNGVVGNTNFTVEGFATQLARLPFIPQRIVDSDSPAEWGDMTDPDPVKIITYILAYNTTYPTVSSITIEDLSNYVLGDRDLSDINTLENVFQIADTVKALAAYAPSGETTIQRNANYLDDTGRNALDTIFNFDVQDYTAIPTLSIEYGMQTGRALAAAAVYDTTLNEITTNWVSTAPVEGFIESAEQTQTVNQILVANSTKADSQDEIRQITANHFAFTNPKPVLTMGLVDGFRSFIPTLYQWWTHTITDDLTARMRVYTTSNRWWLQSINYTATPADNSSATTAVFVGETQSTNAGIRPTLVPDVNANQYTYPGISSGDFFLDDPLVNHPIDTPDIDFPFSGNALTDPFGNMNGDVEIGMEALDVSMKTGGTKTTTRNTVFGENYFIRVEGDGNIYAGIWIAIFNFLENEQGFAPVEATDFETGGVYDPGVGWIQTLEGIDTFCSISRQFNVATTLKSVEGRYDLDNSGHWDGGVVFQSLRIFPNNDHTDPGRIDLIDLPAITDGSGLNKVIRWVGTQAVTATDWQEIQIHSGRDFSFLEQGSLVIFKLTLTGIGTPPFGLTETGKRGDAFYFGYDTGSGAQTYGGSNGLLINAARPSGFGPYDGGHVYEFLFAGTGAPLAFNFLDSDYSDNDNNFLRVTVVGANMGLTP